MTPVQTVDPFDVRYATRSSGALAEFNRAGVLSGADLHVANTLGRLGGESDGRVLLAIALAVRAVRLGSVCIDVRQLRETIAADTEEYVDPGTLPWPEPAEWHASCQAQPAGRRRSRRRAGPSGAPGRRPALPRPVLAPGASGPGLHHRCLGRLRILRPQACLLRQARDRVAILVTTLNVGEPVEKAGPVPARRSTARATSRIGSSVAPDGLGL